MTKRLAVCDSPLRTAIEQGVARGWGLWHIAGFLGVDIGIVYAVRRRMDEAVTEPDLHAAAAYTRNRQVRAATGTRGPQPHGTTAAYHRHRRYGQRPCLDCRAAYAQARALKRGRGVFRAITDSLNDPADACRNDDGAA